MVKVNAYLEVRKSNKQDTYTNNHKKSEFNPKTKMVSPVASAIVIYGLCLPGDDSGPEKSTHLAATRTLLPRHILIRAKVRGKILHTITACHQGDIYVTSR